MVWAIGDIQGCYHDFRALLEKIEFDPKRDRLWLAGDLVNRGEGSLETLLYLYSIRKSLTIVLGNHDITLFAAYLTIKKSNPTLDPILRHPQADKLIRWMRSQKFFHIDESLGYCMAHAGVSPQFGLAEAKRAAKLIEKSLHSDAYGGWLIEMFGREVDHYDESLSGIEKQRYILSSFIRMRYCYEDGRLEFGQKGAPDPTLMEQKGLMPWYACASRRDIAPKILFGHWSTLGYFDNGKVSCLDTGCVWGGKMTAMRLDSREEIVELSCPKERPSG